MTIEFYISRTLEAEYSSFFETILLIDRSTQLFSVKKREKRKKTVCNKLFSNAAFRHCDPTSDNNVCLGRRNCNNGQPAIL